ncbi:MAG: phosphotyrosine protein phosphatase [Acetivibrio sp.]
MNNKKYNRILFVGMGNTCRGPIAETLFKSYEEEEETEVLSRGMVVLFSEPCNPKARIVLSNHGLDLPEKYRSKQLKEKDITEHTLILTMTVNQKNKVREEFGKEKNVYAIKEFVDEEGDVLDPYGGDLLDYEACFSDLHRLVKKTIYKLNEELE